MNEKNIELIEKYTEMRVEYSELDSEVDEYKLREYIKDILPTLKNPSEEEVEEAIKRLEMKLNITMDTGTIIKDKDNYKSWYFNSIAERGTKYWDRYRKYLDRTANMPNKVINTIEDSAEQIMDNLGDPMGSYEFCRKGLVIGAVQSGKTSNYIALMNKAADSGYKTIILLTGTIEKLRKQTQGRVDEGFSGIDSKAQMLQKKTVKIGVGEFEQLYVTSLTTTEKDFNISEAIRIEDQRGPVVFVLKKNKKILEKLYNWLKIHNIDQKTKKIESPLLLIDDEADNASINTSKEDESATVINQNIRNIISLFSKTSYVGFTATPFANIFIDPQLESKDGDDLFPRDFIYLLKQPSNYVGPSSMYPEDGKYNYMLRNNDDVENILPLKHKKEDRPSRLPKTLEDSIIVFFLANAIRDIRGDYTKHRSMLIHISRFIDVQDYTKNLVDDFVRYLKIKIKNYANLDIEEDDTIKRIHKIFDEEFGNKKMEYKKEEIKEEWKEVKEMLYKAVAPIQVKVVNSGTASKNLNYDENDNGLRIIAIGGLSLARGLTLEGLMTSYFYRNTKMYDTLMQMGRWFGYRDGYVDLCRLWTTEESAEWYAHISTATEDLRSEIERMAAQNKKPIEFGLKVRSFNDTPLIITAKNKMRSSEKVEMKRSLNGQMTETPILHADRKMNSENNFVIESWLAENKDEYLFDKTKLELERDTLKNVPKEKVISLLDQLKFPYLNDISEVVKNIGKKNSSVLKKWDVFIASSKIENNPELCKYGSLEIVPPERSFSFSGQDNEFIKMSGSKRRLGQTSFAKAGLEKEEYRLIEEAVLRQRESLGRNKKNKLKSASEYMYFSTGIKRNPLLIIYPIKLKSSEDKEIKKFVEENTDLYTGISIGIPEIEGNENIVYNYRINIVAQRELLGMDKDFNEPDDEDDEDLLN